MPETLEIFHNMAIFYFINYFLLNCYIRSSVTHQLGRAMVILNVSQTALLEKNHPFFWFVSEAWFSLATQALAQTIIISP